MAPRQGFTIWLTGLPCSGKTTLAALLQQALSKAGFAVEILDGDEVRRRLSPDLGFSKEEREEHLRRIAYVAQLLTRVGAVALVAAISPYRTSREHARNMIGRFAEVYLACPLAVCKDRDVKGLYAKAERGEVPHFTGISDPYEPPLTPELVVRTDQEPPEASLRAILTRLADLGFVRGEAGQGWMEGLSRIP